MTTLNSADSEWIKSLLQMVAKFMNCHATAVSAQQLSCFYMRTFDKEVEQLFLKTFHMAAGTTSNSGPVLWRHQLFDLKFSPLGQVFSDCLEKELKLGWMLHPFCNDTDDVSVLMLVL